MVSFNSDNCLISIRCANRIDSLCFVTSRQRNQYLLSLEEPVNDKALKMRVAMEMRAGRVVSGIVILLGSRPRYDMRFKLMIFFGVSTDLANGQISNSIDF